MATYHKRHRSDDDGDDDGYVLKDAPDPIAGKDIPASYLKLFGLLVVAVLFVVVCGFMLFDTWVRGEEQAWLPFALTWWGSILCVIGFGIGLLGTFGFAFEFFCPKRLVLGKDAFQLVRRWPSGAAVEVHIPYDNLRRVVYEKKDDAWRVGLDLYDLGDRDTFAKDPNDLKQLEKQGRDYILDGGYTTGLEEIADLLDGKRRRAKQRRLEAEAADDEDE